MCECRYYGKCAGNCDSHGLVLGFGNETYDCDDFQPMPDVDALMKLSDEMEEFGSLPVKHPGVCVLHDEDFSRELGYARRIREALGVSDDE